MNGPPQSKILLFRMRETLGREYTAAFRWRCGLDYHPTHTLINAARAITDRRVRFVLMSAGTKVWEAAVVSQLARQHRVPLHRVRDDDDAVRALHALLELYGLAGDG